MSNKNNCPVDLQKFSDLRNEDARNRLLLECLSDDRHRALLFDEINLRGGTLSFPSRDSGQRERDGGDLGMPRRPPAFRHRDVVLITDRTAILDVLLDRGATYSSRVYAELGGGSFMLALDPKTAVAHMEQRDAFFKCFPHDGDLLRKLAHAACQAASVMALKAPEFDLAAFAEQAAIRFCQKLMGYSFRDYTLLEATLRAAYRGLVYQVLGRHFATDPLAIPAAKQAMARLLARTSELIDAYATNDEDGLRGCEDSAGTLGLQRVLPKLAKETLDLNAEQRAVLAVGAAVGTVGNVQAAACIAVKALFLDDLGRKTARELALGEPGSRETSDREFGIWKDLLQQSLRDNPPIPFLPRVRIDTNGDFVDEVLLALGGGTRSITAPSGADPLIWGLPHTGHHWCAGMDLAWPLIVEIVRHVMRLPGLAQRRDPKDASIIGLKKRWGFACESYPLTYQRERRVAQSSLNVAMRLKSPVNENAGRVREVIRSGAPRIEQALRESRHVHFAWFELIEGDTVLVLHTVYDGPFAVYLQHFALKVGDLFDALFECIENPPPMPVRDFPHEFSGHLQRYDRGPTMGYFFSAYPSLEVAAIQRMERDQP